MNDLIFNVTETINGKTELLAIFKYYEDAKRYVVDELKSVLESEIESGYVEIENTYTIHTIRLKNLDFIEIT